MGHTRAEAGRLPVLSATRGTSYSPQEVLITVGGKFANYAFFSSLFRRGDSIVLLKPYWFSFRAMPKIVGLKIIESWAREPYHLDHENLKLAMSRRPRAMVVNSPNNPTGGLLDHDDVRLLADLAVDFNLMILSDEIDWAYVYDGRKFLSPASHQKLRDRTVVTDGFSKVFGMSGWRVGFAAGPRPILEKMHVVQEHAVSGPSTFAQHGCVSALSGYEEYVRNLLRVIDSNRRRTVEVLNSIQGLKCPLPEGGFYVYPEISGSGFADAAAFSRELLRSARRVGRPWKPLWGRQNAFQAVLCPPGT